MKKYKCAKCGWIYDPAIGDPKGQVGILSITDKQFGSMELFTEKKSENHLLNILN